MRLSTLIHSLIGISLVDHALAWEGINCKGSGFCGKHIWGKTGDEHREGAHSMIEQLHSLMIKEYRLPGCRTPPGEVIVCRANFQGAICAAQQHTRGGKEFPVVEVHSSRQQRVAPGLNATQVLDLLQHLMDYGCKVCGSVPVGYPHNNDPEPYGVLTVNYNHYGTSPYPNGVQYDCAETPDDNYYGNPFKKNNPNTDHDGYKRAVEVAATGD